MSNLGSNPTHFGAKPTIPASSTNLTSFKHVHCFHSCGAITKNIGFYIRHKWENIKQTDTRTDRRNCSNRQTTNWDRSALELEFQIALLSTQSLSFFFFCTHLKVLVYWCFIHYNTNYIIMYIINIHILKWNFPKYLENYCTYKNKTNRIPYTEVPARINAL